MREKRNDRERVRDKVRKRKRELTRKKKKNGDTQVRKKSELYTDIDRSIKNDLKHDFIQRH